MDETMEEYLRNEIVKLLNVLGEIRDLARTSLPISSMTQEQWNAHRLNVIAGEADQALK